jgi:heme-degrading monooxygenase HmoA
MAIVVRTTIQSADQEAHDRLEQSVATAMARLGGPPEGLMVHLAHPSGQDFLIVEVWRSESAFRSWWNDGMDQALVDAGLTAGDQDISPVWSFARP